jgi:membrane protein
MISPVFLMAKNTMVYIWMKIKELMKNLIGAGNRWAIDDCNLWAMATAYTALFSLLPLMLVLMSILGLVLEYSPNAQTAQAELLEMIGEATNEEVAGFVEQFLSDIRGKAGLTGPFALAFLAVAGVGIFSTVGAAFDRIWQVPLKFKFTRLLGYTILGRLRGIVVLLGVGLLLVIAFILGSFFSAARPYIIAIETDSPLFEFLQELLDASATFVFNWVGLLMIYKWLPKKRVGWFSAMRGALLTALLWAGVRRLLGMILMGTRYSAYGVIGAVIVIMLWNYIAASLLFFGAEYVHLLDKREHPEILEEENPPGEM